ncbi:UNVERIFIED_CONTAM: hypothetical protein H355_010017 [Colinus virginianus]|nr:hypothetical protein H355_010017 [Colinus virginianus]
MAAASVRTARRDADAARGGGCVVENERLHRISPGAKDEQRQRTDVRLPFGSSMVESANVRVGSAMAKSRSGRGGKNGAAAASAVEERDSGGLQHALKLVGIVAGIYAFFLLFGYYQEQIYHLQDPVTGRRFSYSFWLVFIVCVSNTLVSLSMLLMQYKGNFKQAFDCVDAYVLKELFFISLTYVGAMLCTNYAMNHINYPTQVLVKSAKMVPIVVGGLLIFRRTYPWYDYLSVVVVTVSLVLFNSAKGGKSSGGHATGSSGTGLLLLCVSLLCDGVTGPRQDRLLTRYSQIGPVLMMFLTNALSIVWTASTTTLIEGKAPYVLLYHEGHALSSVLAFALSGSLGQIFIYQSLKAFGSLYTSLFTTLRKATSTVLSVYVFGHSLTSVQWCSMTSIFVTLMVQSYCSKKRKSKLKSETITKKA